MEGAHLQVLYARNVTSLVSLTEERAWSIGIVFLFFSVFISLLSFSTNLEASRGLLMRRVAALRDCLSSLREAATVRIPRVPL